MSRPNLRTAIRTAMRERGIPSVVVLCREAGVSRNTLYNWEGGITAPALDELEKVAQRLDVPLSRLVDAWSGRITAQQEEAPPEWAGLVADEAAKKAIESLFPEEVRAALPRLLAQIEQLAAQLPPLGGSSHEEAEGSDQGGSTPPAPGDAGHSRRGAEQ